MQAELDKINQTYSTKILTLQNKIEAQEMDVKTAENSVNQRTLEEVASAGAFALSMLGGRKKSLSSSVSKERMRQTAKDKLGKEKLDLENLHVHFIDDVNLETSLRWSKIDLIPQVTHIFHTGVRSRIDFHQIHEKSESCFTAAPTGEHSGRESA